MLKNKLYAGLITLAALVIAMLALKGAYDHGFEDAGGLVTKHLQEELLPKEDFSQFIDAELSIEDAMKTNAYTHCIQYPGVGIIFSGENEKGELIVSQVLGGYPIDKLKSKGVVLTKGDIVETPLEVIKGDLGSPLLIRYRKIDDRKRSSKEILVTRKLIKKCFLKEKKSDEDKDQKAD